jgi:S-DNA-T family DNA segregation ATPase FtsK/SpoIIIE
MSGRKRKKRSGGPSWWEAPWVSGLVLLVLACYLGLSLTGAQAAWWAFLDGGSLPNPLDVHNPGGPVGAVLAFAVRLVFGVPWGWVVPVLMAAIGLGTLLGRMEFLRPLLLRTAPLWLVSVIWLGQAGWPWGDALSARLAGAVGAWSARGVQSLVGLWGGRLFLTLSLLVTVALVFKPWLVPLGRWLAPVGAAVWSALAWLGRSLGDLLALGWRALVALVAAPWRAARKRGSAPQAKRRRGKRAPAPAADDVDEREMVDDLDEDLDEFAEPAPKERRVHWPEEPEREPVVVAADPVDTVEGGEDGADTIRVTPAPVGPVDLPALELLAEPDVAAPELSPAELDEAADKLEETLRSFGVEGEVKDVRPGPVVTTYEYQPAAGIRVNQIVQRANDLALAMRARSLRMEAPIPGKAAVGIEIPNSNAQMVSLRDILQSEQGKNRKPLTVTLGKDVVGQPVSIDLAAQPHLLVAGSTGSGKSVCLNAMITNLLLYNTPSTLRLMLIDPKMLEMNVYNGIPHLLLPVVTDPKEALRAMNWMVAQMDQRYRQLSRHSVRNIEQYNDKVAAGQILDADGNTVTEPMPYYVTIVDELADLMVQLGQDFEIPVTRLAQKARAVGMHLVLATQRPSVDVLTGVIKANIPCRIAFRVIQRNDSRTVLDQNGAEQLLGRGDMLYLMPGRAQPVRVHGAFVDVPECEAVAEHWRQYSHMTDEISLTAGAGGGTGVHTGEDELFEDAVRVVVSHQSGSTSLLQRRLRIGYTRAGRLMDMMEEAGIVGPFTGSKARDVLVKPNDLPDLFADEAED